MSTVFGIKGLLDETTPARRASKTMVYRPFGAFRLLLAALVLFQHFTANAAPDVLRLTFRGYSPGSSAVLVFFALSGFVIAEAVERFYADNAVGFLVNRMLRIIPHFVCAVVLSIVIHYGFLSYGTLRDTPDFVPVAELAGAFSPLAILANLFGFLPIPVHRLAGFDFLAVAWAIRIEMAFYLAVFLALAAVRTLRLPAHALNPALAMAATALAVLAGLGYLPAKVGLVAYFAFGWSLYLAVGGSRLAIAFTLLMFPAMQVNFLAHPIYGEQAGLVFHFVAAGLLTVALLGVFIILSRCNLSRLRRLDQKLGDLTFPLYMYHLPVLVTVMAATKGYSLSAYAFGIVASVALSYGMSQLIDPQLTHLRNRVRGRSIAVGGDGDHRVPRGPDAAMGAGELTHAR